MPSLLTRFRRQEVALDPLRESMQVTYPAYTENFSPKLSMRKI